MRPNKSQTRPMSRALASLYRTLGLDPAPATPEPSVAELKRAYRAAAKRSHPDMPSGSSAEFARVAFAYRVLSTPTLLEEFTATGRVESETDPEAKLRADAANMLLNTFSAVCSATRDTVHTDIVGEMRKQLQQLRREGDRKRSEQQRHLEAVTAVRDRLIYRGKGGSLLHEYLVTQEQRHEAALRQIRHTQAVCAAAVELLQVYEYTHEKGGEYAWSVETLSGWGRTSTV